MNESVILWPAEVDLNNADVLENELREWFDQAAAGDVVVVDLERVSFIDSTGLGVLIAARTRSLETSSELILRRPVTAVRRLLHITGLEIMFTLH